MLNSNRFITSFRIISLSILLYLPTLAQANDTTPAMDFWCDYFQTLGEDCIALPPIPDEPQELAEWEAFLDAFIVAAFKSTKGPTITIPQKLPQNSTASISVKAMNTHFNSDSEVKIEKNDNDSLIQINSIAFESPEELIINVTVPAEIEAPSQYDIVVETPLNNNTIEKITGENMLHITGASSIPEIISIMPSHVKQGANSVSITFYAVGVDFDENSEIHFGNLDENSEVYSGDSYFTVEEIIIHNEISLTAVLSIDELTPKKLYNTTIKTGTQIAEAVMYSGFLQVYQAALPELIAIEPSHGRQTETIDIVITGENVNFSDESEIQFDGTGIEVLPTSVTAITSTQISATIKIADDAELTSRTISVITGAEETEPLYYAFTVEEKISISSSPSSSPVNSEPEPPPSDSDFEPDDVDNSSDTGTDDDIEEQTDTNPNDAVTVVESPPTEPVNPPSTVSTDSTEVTEVDDNNTPSAETNPEELPPTYPVLPPSSSFPSHTCPEKGEVKSKCNAKGITITDLKVSESGHIDGGTLKGTLENNGWVTNFILESGSQLENNSWVANLTIKPEAVLRGGIWTSYIISEGILIDIDFRGASVIGGYLGGTISNNSKVDGYFKDVSLMPNTRISGGALKGHIKGDPQYPALLDSLKVMKNSHLSHVIIGSDVELAKNVTLGDGVVKMEKAVAINFVGAVDTESLMIGGSFVNDGDFKLQNELSRSDSTTIYSRIHVEPAHIGLRAEILICAAYKPLTSPRRKPLFYMIDTEDKIHLWDEEIASLVTFREIESLGEVEDIEIYSGFFNFTGVLNIYFGYRLEDGTVVYNLKTIDVTLME
ncbi:MAG: hypothetical protein DRQ57_13665 [Gammaproteobacteria bacterium]|nr:MAG: hypothetical protein DRQ57_13665 [Gammaproteobacteria bacterium]